LTTIKTQQEDLERDVCDDGEGALFSSFAYSEDESEEDLRTTVDEELRLFREKWSTVFAAEEKEEDKEEEEEMLERDHHLVCDERTKRSFIKRTDEEDGVKTKSAGQLMQRRQTRERRVNVTTNKASRATSFPRSARLCVKSARRE
jgi:GTP-dependent phosphoenolpyruvate carboxykinase